MKSTNEILNNLKNYESSSEVTKNFASCICALCREVQGDYASKEGLCPNDEPCPELSDLLIKLVESRDSSDDGTKCQIPTSINPKMQIRYTLKSGEILYYDFELSDIEQAMDRVHIFERWYTDRIMHEGAMFPIHGGRISLDGILRMDYETY